MELYNTSKLMWFGPIVEDFWPETLRSHRQHSSMYTGAPKSSVSLLLDFLHCRDTSESKAPRGGIKHFSRRLTASADSHIVLAISVWCVYEGTGFHLGNIRQDDLGRYARSMTVDRAGYVYVARSICSPSQDQHCNVRLIASVRKYGR